MTKTLKIICCTLCVAFFVSGCDKKEEATSLVSTRNLAKTLTLSGIDGTKTDMVFTGNGFTFTGANSKKAVLTVFFATWCPPCKAEIPNLIELQQKYKDKLSIVAILVADKKTNDEMNAFAKSYGINYFVANGPTNEEASEMFGGIKGIPTMFLFDKNGKQTAYYPGATPKGVLEQDILKTVGK